MGKKESEFNGLMVGGVVTPRTRREVANEHTVVRYWLNDGQDVHQVEHWNPVECFGIGQQVSLPVTVRAFVTKRGQALAVLQVKGADPTEF